MKILIRFAIVSAGVIGLALTYTLTPYSHPPIPPSVGPGYCRETFWDRHPYLRDSYMWQSQPFMAAWVMQRPPWREIKYYCDQGLGY